MKQIDFLWQNSLISPDAIDKHGEQLQPEYERVRAAWGAGYKTEYASLSLPSDEHHFRMVQELIDEKKSLQLAVCVVVGIGGSSLGARAIYEALGPAFLDERAAKVDCFFVTTVDSCAVDPVYRRCEAALANGQDILVTVISKSGTTTETIANAQLFLQLLLRYEKPYKDYVVVITDDGSPLCKAAHRDEMSCLHVPKLVGGRFSVFSAVGLFPLGMLGVDIQSLCAGAQSMKDACSDSVITNNPAALRAAILYEQYRIGVVIHDTFIFSCRLHGVAQWYRQLMGESIGKERNRSGELVHVGITPTISIGTMDLHSVAQLYLAGPYNRVTTFLAAPKERDILRIESGTPFDLLVPMIQEKSFTTIMSAIELGVQKAYQKSMRPFMTMMMPEISEYALGQLLQLHMVEIMYLGFLFSINPFDQPQVELYKKETREILDHE